MLTVVFIATKNLTHNLKGQCDDIQWFFWAFLREEKWRLLTQMSRTSDHDSSASRANNFTAQAESRNCRFPQAIVIFRGLALWPPLFFPHKMAAKNHRLSWHCRFNLLPVLEVYFNVLFSFLSDRLKFNKKKKKKKKQKSPFLSSRLKADELVPFTRRADFRRPRARPR